MCLSLRLPGADLLRSLISGGFVNNTQTCGLRGGCMGVRVRNRGACEEGETLPVTPHWSMSLHTELLISKGRFRKSYFPPFFSPLIDILGLV